MRAAAADQPVVVLLVPSLTTKEPVVDAIRAQLGELHVEVRVTEGGSADLDAALDAARREATGAPALGVFWIGERDGVSALFLYDAARSRVLMRGLPPGDSAAATDEAAAIIVRSTVVALLEGTELAMEVIELPAAEVVPTPTPPSSDPVAPAPPNGSPKPARGRLSLAYVGAPLIRRWASGAHLALALRPLAELTVGGGCALYAPVVEEGAGARFRLTRHPCDLFAGWEQAGRRHAVAVELALQADALRRTPVALAPELSAAGPNTTLVWALTPRVRGAFAIARAWSVHGGIGLEALLTRVEYVVEGAGDERSTALLPFRPRADLGVAVTVF